MCSSSELQRITLSATKIISAEGSVELEPLAEEAVESDEETLEGDNEEAKTGDDHSTAEIVTPVSAAPNYKERGMFVLFLTKSDSKLIKS